MSNPPGQLQGEIASPHAEVLRESEERLRLALAAGRMIPWDYDVLANRAIVSQDAAALVGLEPGLSIDHLAFFSMVHPDDQAVVARAGERSFHEKVDLDA